MARFVLIDHSIKRLGGHNFEYATHVLKAAEDMGYAPTLVTNERFFETKRLPKSWNVLANYRNTTYEVPKWEKFRSQFAKRKNNLVNLAKFPFDFVRSKLYAKYLGQFTSRFAADTVKTYEQLKLTAGDLVMFSTIMQSELDSLVELFKARPELAKIDCHMMFHFQLFKGREPDYAAQLPSAAAFQKLMHEAKSLPDQKIFCYCTNDPLARQYRSLDSLNVTELPWSVNPQFGENLARHQRNPEHPLRIGVPGCTRDERGMPLFERIVSSLEKEFQRDRSAQLVLQAKRAGKLSPKLRQVATFHKTPEMASIASSPIAVVKWPLSSEDYLQMVEMTDIGLLLYDAKEYYARASGVLVEMLNSGIPVIVSSASWLSEQIADANWKHVDRMIETVPPLATCNAKQIEWQIEPADEPNTKASTPRIHNASRAESIATIRVGGAAQHKKIGVVAVPKDATHLAVNFAWHGAASVGTFIDLQVETRNRYGLNTQHWHEILARRTEQTNARQGTNSATTSRAVSQGVLIPLPPDSSVVELTLANAFDRMEIELDQFECRFLDAFATPHGCPLSAVGLSAADPNMAPMLIREMIRNYDHYRATAIRHAADYREIHSPQNVVEIMRSKSAGDDSQRIRRVG